MTAKGFVENWLMSSEAEEIMHKSQESSTIVPPSTCAIGVHGHIYAVRELNKGPMISLMARRNPQSPEHLRVEAE